MDKGFLHEMLAWLYSVMYHETQDEARLESAIQFSEVAVAKTSPNSEGWPQQMLHYSQALKEKYDRFGKIIDLNHAISVAERAWKHAASYRLIFHDESEAGLILTLLDTDVAAVPVLDLLDENEETGFSSDILNRLASPHDDETFNSMLCASGAIRHPPFASCALHLGALLIIRYEQTQDWADFH